MRIQWHQHNIDRTRSIGQPEQASQALARAAGSRRTSVSVRSIRSEQSNATARPRRHSIVAPAPSVASRPPTPPPKDTRDIRAAPPYTARDTVQSHDDERKSRWVLYDENGEVRKVWALEYSDDKHKSKRIVPTHPEETRKGDSVSGAKKEVRAYTAQSIQESGITTRTRSSRIVRSVGLPFDDTLTPADPWQSDAGSSRFTHTSEEVANCLGLFEAQERITVLESQRDNLRRRLREQQNRMMTMPHSYDRGGNDGARGVEEDLARSR